LFRFVRLCVCFVTFWSADVECAAGWRRSKRGMQT